LPRKGSQRFAVFCCFFSKKKTSALLQISPWANSAGMNMLAPPRTKLTIEVILDLVCPWCFLGTKRLLRTLRQRPGVLFELQWRPFLLNPDMPRAGIARGDYLVRKFGSADRAERLHGTVAALGRAEGITFQFDRIAQAPSSVNAHRLVALASRYGVARELVEALFSAHFCEGEDIGDARCLLRIAHDAGLPLAPTRALLASDEGADQVHAENLHAHRMCVNGVPCFILAQRHAIAGAQEAEVFERLIDVALNEASEL